MMLPFGTALRQPDQRSCGPSCLVVARMLQDPSYAEVSGPQFGAEVLATHRRVTGRRPAAGALQVPWPRALGTPPWAVAREIGRTTGDAYRWRPARWRRSAAYDRVLAGLATGLPVPLYVGSVWLPRHVVLAIRADGDVLEVYNPASGGLVRVDREAFAVGRLGLGSWHLPWFDVTP